MKFADYFDAIPELETDRLLLRAFHREDIDRYLAIVRSPGVQKYLGGGLNNLPNDQHIANWLNNINGRLLKSKTVFTWCIWHKADEKVVGRIDLGGFLRKSVAELSSYFAEDYWGQGLATEAVKRVVRFGLEELRLHRIQATVMPENAASLRVLEKAGLCREGLLRSYSFGKEFHDVVILSVIEEANMGVNR